MALTQIPIGEYSLMVQIGVTEMHKILILISAAIFVLAASMSSSQERSFAGSNAGLGEIKVSLLDPTDFERLYGPDWRLLSSDVNVSGLPIAQFLSPDLQEEDGNIFLPEGRGKFLRMTNQGQTGTGFDPEQRVAGSLQGTQMPQHSHITTFSNDAVPRNSHRRTNTPYYLYDTGRGGRTKNYQTSTAGTGAESRPVNLAVNFYVRVDCSTGGVCDE